VAVISLPCRADRPVKAWPVAGERCPEKAVIVISIPNCRHCLSALVSPQFRTRIDNVRGGRPVQRYRPLHRWIRAVPEARFCTSGNSRQPNLGLAVVPIFLRGNRR